jgi:hypothetical protein
MRNRIINGAMLIDQRNNGASVSPLAGYCVDRWNGGYLGSGTGRFSAQQSSTAPTGFKNSLLLTVTTADSSPSTNYGYVLQQPIEGFNIYDANFGTANAKSLTASFWVYSSVTGTFPFIIDNYNGTRAYGTTYTISSANTWTYITLTIPGDTGGTWVGATSGGAMDVSFGFGGGSGRTLSANTWTTPSGSLTQTNVTGCTQLIATNGATFYVTGVQLEVGTAATPFEYRLYGAEFILCQRYYQVYSYGAYAFIWTGDTTNTNSYYYSSAFSPSMRTGPTATIINSAVSNFGTPSFSNADVNSFRVQATASTGVRSYFQFNASFSAEL